jgi:hypothetical protein
MTGLEYICLAALVAIAANALLAVYLWWACCQPYRDRWVDWGSE